MYRFKLTKSACRTIEFQISKEEKKFNSRDSRNWNNVAQKFIVAADDFDKDYEEIGNNVRKQSVKFAVELADLNIDDPKIDAKRAAINQKISASNAETQDKISVLEETSGKDIVEVDLEKEELDLFNKLWNELTFPRERSIRQQISEIANSFDNPIGFKKNDSGEYVAEITH